MGTISFARGVPAPECLPIEELAECARAALIEGRRAPCCSTGRGRLRPAARVDRRASRRRAGARRDHERLPAGLRLPRRAAREARRRACSSRRRRTTARSRSSAPRRRHRRRADGRGRPRSPRSSGSRRRRRVPLHDPDLPEPDRAARSRSSGASGSSSSRASATCSCSRTTRTGSCASTASRCRRCSSSPAARGRRLRLVLLEDGRAGRARRLLRPAARAREADRGARDVDVHLAAVPDAGDRARVLAPRQLRAEPRARQRPAEGTARRDARGAGAPHAGRRHVEPPRGRLFHLARPAATMRLRSSRPSAPA